MLSKNICNRCRQEATKGCHAIDDWKWWTCPYSGYYSGKGATVSEKQEKPPPNCPKKFEHAIAETKKC